MPLEPDLDRIREELIAREPIFHHPELGTTRADFERMTAEDFREIGASGRIFTRKSVLDLLEERHATPHTEDLQPSDFQCRALAPDLYQITYNLIQDQTRHTRRSTLWRSTEEGWKIVFHQGTIVQSS